MNESALWSFLYFMGEGRERGTGANQKSAKRIKPTPRQLGKARGGDKKPPRPLGKKPVGGQEKPPRQLGEKAVGGQEKTPRLSLARAAQGQGQRARVRSQRSEPKPGLTPRPKEASTSPPTRAEKHTQRKKRCYGYIKTEGGLRQPTN